MAEQVHWKHTWPCAEVLGQFIAGNSALFRDRHALELGAGATGVCGLVAAKVGAVSVVFTDHPGLAQAFSILEKNIAKNGVSERCKVQGLDWNNPELETLARVDVVIASDVFYEPTVFEPLVNTIDKLLTKFPKANVFFAYQNRDDWSIAELLIARKLGCSLIRTIEHDSYTIQLGSIYRISMADEDVFAGIEGGGSCSRLVFLNAKAEPLGEFPGSGTNLFLNGLELTANQIAAWVRDSKEKLGIKGPLRSLGMGLSGAEDPAMNEKLVNYLLTNHGDVTEKAHLVSDSVACIGASFKNGGVVLIAGTGSACRMLTETGEEHQVGGWGHMIGDSGSAYWIANRGIRLLFDVDDGVVTPVGSVETLRKLVLEYFNITDKVQVLDYFYNQFSKSNVARLTERMAAVADDPVIAQLFFDGGFELGKHVAAISAHMSEAMLKNVPIVMVGSVFKSWNLLKPGFIEAVKTLAKRRIEAATLHQLSETNAFGAAAIAAAKEAQQDLPFVHQPIIFDTIELL
ncbi:unnamed protein product, partial [Mesorhabditis spiculigera]